jgi:hypothetical protein
MTIQDAVAILAIDDRGSISIIGSDQPNDLKQGKARSPEPGLTMRLCHACCAIHMLLHASDALDTSRAEKRVCAGAADRPTIALHSRSLASMHG